MRNTQRELQMSGRDPKQPKSVHSADNCPAHPLHLETFVYRKPKCGSWFHLCLNTESAKGIRESHDAGAVSLFQALVFPVPI